MPRKRKQVRLGRLRKTVRAVNTIYGLLLQAHEQLRGRVLALEGARWDDERDVARQLDEEQEQLVAMGTL